MAVRRTHRTRCADRCGFREPTAGGRRTGLWRVRHDVHDRDGDRPGVATRTTAQGVALPNRIRSVLPGCDPRRSGRDPHLSRGPRTARRVDGRRLSDAHHLLRPTLARPSGAGRPDHAAGRRHHQRWGLPRLLEWTVGLRPSRRGTARLLRRGGKCGRVGLLRLLRRADVDDHLPVGLRGRASGPGRHGAPGCRWRTLHHHHGLRRGRPLRQHLPGGGIGCRHRRDDHRDGHCHHAPVFGRSARSGATHNRTKPRPTIDAPPAPRGPRRGRDRLPGERAIRRPGPDRRPRAHPDAGLPAPGHG